MISRIVIIAGMMLQLSMYGAESTVMSDDWNMVNGLLSLRNSNDKDQAMTQFYSCSVCYKTYAEFYEFKMHIFIEHQTCPMDNVYCNTIDNQMQHAKNCMKISGDEYQCIKGYLEGVNRKVLHLQLVKPIGYYCSQCERLTSDRCALHSFIRPEHPARSTCPMKPLQKKKS